MNTTYEIIENAIDAAKEAKQELLLIDPTPKTKAILDASYNALKAAIENLSKLLEGGAE